MKPHLLMAPPLSPTAVDWIYYKGRIMGQNKFMFATGIENSYPTIILPDGSTKRVDELEKTGHYTHWEQDFKLCNEMGIEYLRYGTAYYNTHTAPGQYNWDFADAAFGKMK